MMFQQVALRLSSSLLSIAHTAYKSGSRAYRGDLTKQPDDFPNETTI